MAKRTKKKTTKRSTRKAPAKRAAAKTTKKTVAKKTTGIGQMSVADLQAELRRRQRGVSKLERRREKLMAELAEVNAEIADLGGSTGGLTAGGRRRNNMTLPDALVKVLEGRTMSVTEASDAVRASGYHSSAANFRTMVNQALLKDKRFKKVARGQYTA